MRPFAIPLHTSTLMKTILTLLLLLLSQTCSAQLVRYTLQTLDMEGEPITMVKAGESFYISLRCQDLRPNADYTPLDGQPGYKDVTRPQPRGVYAGCCFITYNTQLCTPFRTTFITPLYKMLEYKNGFTQDASLTQIEYNIGVKVRALRGLNAPQGTDEIEMLRLRMAAIREGIQTFSISLAGLSYPIDHTVIYQHQIRMTDPPFDVRALPKDIIVEPVSLTIRPVR